MVHQLVILNGNAAVLASSRIYDSRGKIAIVSSEDVVLEDGKVIWRFRTQDARYDGVYAEITCKPSFEQAMSIGTGVTLSMSGML